MDGSNYPYSSVHNHRGSPAEPMNFKFEDMDCGPQYQIVDYLGCGSYGTVCAAVHLPSMTKVAIKRCKDVIRSRTLVKRTIREVRILRYLSHPNVINLHRVLTPSGCLINDLDLVFELMDSDLSQVIKSPQELTMDHVKFFLYQILCAVSYLHDNHIVHRDIKPRNILVNADCVLKLADFGLARLLPAAPCVSLGPVAISDYVTTRWYRAPEVLTGWIGQYSLAVDMWAVGCILVELINRTPLFPGRDSFRQLELIVQILGKPESDYITRCTKMGPRRFLRDIPSVEPKPLKEFVPHAATDALDLIRSLLVFFPEDRLTAKEALHHGFVAEAPSSLHADLVYPKPSLVSALKPAMFEHEVLRYDLNSLKTELLQEIDLYSSQQSDDYDDDEDRTLSGQFFGPGDSTALPFPPSDSPSESSDASRTVMEWALRVHPDSQHPAGAVMPQVDSEETLLRLLKPLCQPESRELRLESVALEPDSSPIVLEKAKKIIAGRYAHSDIGGLGVQVEGLWGPIEQRNIIEPPAVESVDCLFCAPLIGFKRRGLKDTRAKKNPGRIARFLTWIKGQTSISAVPSPRITPNQPMKRRFPFSW